MQTDRRAEPSNLGRGWVGFDFEKAFKRPVQLINDAAMQALGGYHGGRMLFLGLGTGLGAALVVQGHLQPLELAHLPYRKRKTFEDYVGEASRLKHGQAPLAALRDRRGGATQGGDAGRDVLLGGGNAKRMHRELDRLPPGTRLGGNADAFRGGMRLWQPGPRARALRDCRSGDSAGCHRAGPDDSPDFRQPRLRFHRPHHEAS